MAYDYEKDGAAIYAQSFATIRAEACLDRFEADDLIGTLARLAEAAGYTVVMVTGDQPVTARNVAHAVGLVEKKDVRAVRGRDLAPAGSGVHRLRARCDRQLPDRTWQRNTHRDLHDARGFGVV